MANFGVFAKSLITRLCGHFWRRGLRHKVLRSLHIKWRLIRRSPDWVQGDFRGPDFEVLFWQFSLGPPFAKSEKIADFGVFSKSLITRLCGYFWRRGLRQKVLRSLHFKSIEISRSPDWRQGDFRGPEVELLFWQFSLDFGVFAKSLVTYLRVHFWSSCVRLNGLGSVQFKCMLIRRDFGAFEFYLVFSRVSLGIPFGKETK